MKLLFTLIFSFVFFTYSVHAQCVFEGTFAGQPYQMELTISNAAIIVNDGGACPNGNSSTLNYDIVFDYVIEYTGNPPSGTPWNFQVSSVTCTDPTGDGPDTFTGFNIPDLGPGTNPDSGTAIINQNKTSSDLSLCSSTSYDDFGCGDFNVTFQWQGVNETMACPVTIITPIKLSYFDVESNVKNQVEIEWVTESEVNNDYFTIEYSVDGQVWKELTTVRGQGDSSSPTIYKYVDVLPAGNHVFYRLMQTDFDGVRTFSAINDAFIDDLSNEIIAYPNPIVDVVTLQARESLTVYQITDVFGRQLPIFINTITDREVQLNVGMFEPGLYVIHTDQGPTKIFKQ